MGHKMAGAPKSAQNNTDTEDATTPAVNITKESAVMGAPAGILMCHLSLRDICKF
jgi:hypothetical protein